MAWETTKAPPETDHSPLEEASSWRRSSRGSGDAVLTITAEDNVVIDEVAAVAPVEEVQHEPAQEQSAVVLQLKIEASDEHGASIRIF